MKPTKNEENTLNVNVSYDKELELITVTFEQDERIITIGFDIPEAQIFASKIADAITIAILGKLDITPPLSPTFSKTKH